MKDSCQLSVVSCLLSVFVLTYRRTVLAIGFANRRSHLVALSDYWQPATDNLLYCTPSRATNLVRSGSLCDARRMASAASVADTPSISKRILPGRTTATQ